MQQFIIERVVNLRTLLNIRCRSFLSPWTNQSGDEVYAGRNNLGVVSLNLPIVALNADGDLVKFFLELDKTLSICFDALMSRIERFRGVKAAVAPILYCEGALGVKLKPDDEVMQVFENGRATVSLGYIGLHETIVALHGESPFDNTDAKSLAICIMQTLKDKTVEWSDKTGFAFGLYGTPSESLCDRALRLTVKRFGIIKGVTDKGYFTNSFHLDVEQFASPFDKIDFEAPFVAISNSGFITYTESSSLIKNLDALESLWDYTADKVPYYGTNTPIDECYQCGFKGEAVATKVGYSCPQCGNHDSDKLSVTRRVCGYLSSPDARPFIKGKQEEVIKRVKHM